MVDEFDLIEFLQMVTAQTSELLGARAAGLLLADPKGRLQLMAASDERAQMIELFQVQALEGPCQDCYRQGEGVVNADLRLAEERWPQLAPQAVAAGYKSVHAFPLRLRRLVIGALNLFGDEPGEISTADATVVQALAEQLQTALNTRIVIEQAKGALAQIHGGTPDEAYERLRTYCRRHQLRLGDVALAVTTDAASVPDLTSP